MKTPPSRFFISHSTKDHQFCLQLVEDLRSVLGDVDAVWYDASGGLHGGDAWWRKIEQELSTRNVFIVVLSPEAVASSWVNDEIDIAWRRKNDPDPARRMRLFPILYKPCKIRPSLESLKIISFVPPNSYQAALEELLLALGLATSRGTGKAMYVSPLTAQKTKEQWINDGNSHYDAKQYQQAIADYDRAIILDPQYAIAYYARGRGYFAISEQKKAIADYDNAIQLDPQYTDAYYARGNTYYILWKYQQAIADYDSAIYLNPQLTDAYYNRGLAYYSLDKFKKAIADFESALLLNPQHTNAKSMREKAKRAKRK
jgi:tetratricopeptide (TPR) repeat protein